MYFRKDRESLKSKIISFIITIFIVVVINIIVFLGIYFYNEITKTDILGDVQNFVSDITIVEASRTDKFETLEKVEIKDIQNQEIVQDNNVNTKKYYYNQLDSYSKSIYMALEKNKENMKTGTFQINIETDFSPVLSQSNGEDLLGEYYQSAIVAYRYDNPDVFYIEFEKLYLNIETTTRGKKKTYKVFLNCGNENNYLTKEFQSKEGIDIALNEIEKVKLYFVQNKKESTYENIKLVHDYLVESIEYDESLSMDNIYNLYGAIVNKKCVCEGYSKAFKYLMDSVDIPSVIIIGTATNSKDATEGHAWNYVQINDIWYGIDCTWDDPILIGPGIISNTHKYKYFLKGEINLNKTHNPVGQFTENGKIFELPKLSEEDF